MPAKGQPMSAEHRAKISAALKGHCVSDDTKRKISENTRAAMKNPDVRKRLSDSKRGSPGWMKGKTHSAETRKKLSIAHKGKVLSPERIEKMRMRTLGQKHTDEHKQLMSIIMHEKYSNGKHPGIGSKRTEETRKTLSIAKMGMNNPNWKGGYHQKPYCFKFNESLKREIREEHGHKCFLCSSIQKTPGLSIHHIDYNYSAGCKNQRFALLPLCTRCHCKTNYRRWYWFNLLICYWLLNPNISLTTYPFSSL
jgi:hypothetical protein